MYPEMIAAILQPILQQHPGYTLRPIKYVFGTSTVELDGPPDRANALQQSILDALRTGGFNAYPMPSANCPIALTARSKQL